MTALQIAIGIVSTALFTTYLTVTFLSEPVKLNIYGSITFLVSFLGTVWFILKLFGV